MSNFTSELAALINLYSLNKNTGMSCRLLADHLVNCLHVLLITISESQAGEQVLPEPLLVPLPLYDLLHALEQRKIELGIKANTLLLRRATSTIERNEGVTGALVQRSVTNVQSYDGALSFIVGEPPGTPALIKSSLLNYQNDLIRAIETLDRNQDYDDDGFFPARALITYFTAEGRDNADP